MNATAVAPAHHLHGCGSAVDTAGGYASCLARSGSYPRTTTFGTAPFLHVGTSVAGAWYV